MRALKTLTVGLNIKNPIYVYARRDENILGMLRSIYEGKCIRSCLVISILRVLRISPCVITQDGEPTYGTVSVTFEASVYIFVEGEVLTGCKVLKKDKDGLVICESPHADIAINYTQYLDPIRVGQIIPVRVGSSRYAIGGSKAAINGVPYIPSFPRLYAVSGGGGDPARVGGRKSPAPTPAPTPTPGWKFFATLIQPVGDINPKVKAAPVEAISAAPQSTYIFADTLSTDGAEQVFMSQTQPFDAPVLYLPREDIISMVTEDLRAHRELIDGLIATYNTDELMKDHRNLWLIIKESKKANRWL